MVFGVPRLNVLLVEIFLSGTIIYKQHDHYEWKRLPLQKEEFLTFIKSPKILCIPAKKRPELWAFYTLWYGNMATSI
jgi:hypothetical protein